MYDFASEYVSAVIYCDTSQLHDIEGILVVTW